MGVLLSFVQGIRMPTWLTQAEVRRSQEGSSRRSVSTASSNSRLLSSPSPRKVLRLILSVERFLVKLLKGRI